MFLATEILKKLSELNPSSQKKNVIYLPIINEIKVSRVTYGVNSEGHIKLWWQFVLTLKFFFQALILFVLFQLKKYKSIFLQPYLGVIFDHFFILSSERDQLSLWVIGPELGQFIAGIRNSKPANCVHELVSGWKYASR